ncbi:hypothetical protein Tco_0637463 [Tanacetum coccineum]
MGVVIQRVQFVDRLVPRKDEEGKRFGFVRFINVFNVDRLVNNLCTIWVGQFKLHANKARFQRATLNKGQGADHKKVANLSRPNSGDSGSYNSYVNASIPDNVGVELLVHGENSSSIFHIIPMGNKNPVNDIEEEKPTRDDGDSKQFQRLKETVKVGQNNGYNMDGDVNNLSDIMNLKGVDWRHDWSTLSVEFLEGTTKSIDILVRIGQFCHYRAFADNGIDLERHISSIRLRAEATENILRTHSRFLFPSSAVGILTPHLPGRLEAKAGFTPLIPPNKRSMQPEAIFLSAVVVAALLSPLTPLQQDAGSGPPLSSSQSLCPELLVPAAWKGNEAERKALCADTK